MGQGKHRTFTILYRGRSKKRQADRNQAGLEATSVWDGDGLKGGATGRSATEVLAVELKYNHGRKGGFEGSGASKKRTSGKSTIRKVDSLAPAKGVEKSPKFGCGEDWFNIAQGLIEGREESRGVSAGVEREWAFGGAKH